MISLRIIIPAIIIIIGLYLYISNNSIEVMEYEEDIKERILIISDLHSKEFGKNNIKLIEKIKKTKPSIILILGDMIDNKKDDIEISLNVIRVCTSICKTYFISGNHETRLGPSLYRNYLLALMTTNVVILNDKSEIYNDILFIGIESKKNKEEVKQVYNNLKEDRFSIVLSHEPQYIDQFLESDIVCSGHAHGGQVRIFKKGLYSPGQGLFPKYTSGRYKVSSTRLYVSRGLGGKDMRVRVFNNPHLILLKPKD